MTHYCSRIILIMTWHELVVILSKASGELGTMSAGESRRRLASFVTDLKPAFHGIRYRESHHIFPNRVTTFARLVRRVRRDTDMATILRYFRFHDGHNCHRIASV